MILLHVVIALLSLVFTSYTYLHPTAAKLKGAYVLIGGTLVTGIYLVWSAPAHLLEGCLMGLFYLALVSVGVITARTKLVAMRKSQL